MFFPARFPALHKTALVFQGFLHSLSSVLQAGLFFSSYKMSFHRSYQNAVFSKKSASRCNSSLNMYVFQNITMYVASVTESKIHHVPNYRLGFIRNKDKNSHVFALYNNFCSTFFAFWVHACRVIFK